MRSVGPSIGIVHAVQGLSAHGRASSRWARMLASALIAKGVGATPIGRVYARAAAGDRATAFFARALDELHVRGRIVLGDLTRVSTTGPLLVVANHPFGAIDGLLLLDLLAPLRPGVRLLANRMLAALPELRPHLVLVDVFGGASTRRGNAVALRQAIASLAGGGCLGVFPAGEVAHRVVEGRVVDSEWHRSVAEIAVRSHATVLPVFFEGQNSRIFRLAGAVHPLLRTTLLPRELWAMRGRCVGIRVGEPIPPETVAAPRDAVARTAFLRSRLDALAVSAPPSAVAPPSRPRDTQTSAARTSGGAPVGPKGPLEAIAADIAALPASALLLESGELQVFSARAARLPAVLLEIGRLREETFRLVGEGTGRAQDLDRFDQIYHHLFVWDRVAREIVGAYRLGATDELGASAGRTGDLYTSTLFDYDPALLRALGPALELGRSFVARAYQRNFSPLMLLWKGISRFVVRAPRYRRLFGVVSISDRYDSTSRQLLLAFLQRTRFDADLGRLVRAKNPPPPVRDQVEAGGRIDRLEDVSARVRALEPDGKDIPVLLRQYLKLNAKLLGFTIDPAFGNVLDGLVVVDLAEVEPAVLARYMGRADAAAFAATHRSIATS
jgi:putative hemolysin